MTGKDWFLLGFSLLAAAMALFSVYYPTILRKQSERRAAWMSVRNDVKH